MSEVISKNIHNKRVSMLLRRIEKLEEKIVSLKSELSSESKRKSAKTEDIKQYSRYYSAQIFANLRGMLSNSGSQYEFNEFGKITDKYIIMSAESLN